MSDHILRKVKPQTEAKFAIAVISQTEDGQVQQSIPGYLLIKPPSIVSGYFKIGKGYAQDANEGIR